jgi:DNA-directed RNA polymerase specialized sigma24 family protein
MYCQEETREREVRALAGQIYTERRRYLLSIARRNATTEADAEEALHDTFANFIVGFDPAGEAPALPWITLALKRQCWRLRENAHHDRRIVALPETRHEEPTGLIERRPAEAPPLPERIGDRDEALGALAQLKRDERTALVLKAAGYSYEEIGRRRGWTYTKTNRCIAEGRAALRNEIAR